jgi:hypothetical protein
MQNFNPFSYTDVKLATSWQEKLLSMREQSTMKNIWAGKMETYY